MTMVAKGTLFGLALLTALGLGCSNNPTEETHFGLAYTYQLDGRDEKAESQYREVISIKPDDPEVYFNMGLLAENRGELSKAEGYYTKARELYSNRMEKMRSENQKIDPTQRDNFAQVYMALGALYFNKTRNTADNADGTMSTTGLLDNALDSFKEAARLSPSHWAFYNQGQCLEAKAMDGQIGDANWQLAVDAYKESLKMRANYGPAHLALAFIHESRGDIDLARMHHSLARQNGVDDPVLVEKLVWWTEWEQEEITAVRGTKSAGTRVEGKFTLMRPRGWRVGAAALAGTTIVQTFDNTAAIVIGEGATVQVIGPDNKTVYGRRGVLSLADYASGGLNTFLEANLPEVNELLLADPNSTPPPGGEGQPPVENTNPWKLVDPKPQTISYVNGATGVVLRLIYQPKDSTPKKVSVAFYLGDQRSYIIVTTQANNDMRTEHALSYLTQRVSEITTSQG